MAAERARIARELHDVVAHNVSVMVVQADGGAFMVDSDPKRARQALETISETGRTALREMRLLLLEEGHCFRGQALSFCKMKSSPPREMLDANSLSTLVQMVSAGIGVTLIPEMAVAVETRSASVSVARFENPQPSRTIGMVWRKTSPLARQLLQISEVVCLSAGKVRGRNTNGPWSRTPRT